MDIEQTLAERGQRYGSFADHAEIVQQFKITMRGTPGFRKMAADQQQALEVIADKIARILNGDPDYLDNWHDIIGYARLVEKRLEDEIAANEAAVDQAPESFPVVSDPGQAQRIARLDMAIASIATPSLEEMQRQALASIGVHDMPNSSINDDGILY